MYSKIKIYIVVLLAGLLFSLPTLAATFKLSPSSGTMIKNCNKVIDVLMDIDSGKSSNAAQIYVDHNFAGAGESVSISGAGLFASYGFPTPLPAGRIGLYGYTNNISGNDKRFARITAKSGNVDAVKNLTIYFSNTSSITSKIADLDSNNILTTVISGSYVVEDGWCESNPPYLSDMNPPANKPNHPLGQDIFFKIKDDRATDSGVKISTLSITLKQGGVPIDFAVNTVKVNSGDDKVYDVTVNPDDQLQHGELIEVGVTVSDFAGNTLIQNYSFNGLTCEQLGCYSATSSLPTCATVTEYIYTTSTEYVSIPDYTTTTIIDTTTEFATTTVTTTLTQTLLPQNSIMPVRFFLDNRSVEATIYNDVEISTLSNTIFTVAADVLNLNETINSAKLVLEGKEMPMYYDNALQMYSVDIFDLVTAGFYQGSVVVNYGDDKTIISNFTISVLSRGYVNLKKTSDTIPFAGVNVALQRMSGADYVLVKKMNTDSSGTYGFVVPNGNYRLVFEAPGFDPVYTSGFGVENNIINRSQTFIEKISLLDPEVSLTEKADYLAGIAGERGQQLIDLSNDPQVEKAMQNYAAPIALGAAVAATAPALSLLNLISYLRFLFLQPFLLLGMRRRKKWGTVYNSLTKMPVDLAVVRLLDANTNRVVQSRVTDAQGRYVFLANPGTYRIIVEQKDMTFPSKVLQGYNEDTNFLDIYHGEIVHVDEKYTVLAVNIPLDPLGAPEKTPRRIIWDKHWKAFQHFIASLSVLAGLVAFIVSPNWWTTLLLVSQILLYFLFKRIAIPKKPKSWGIVYDKETQKPVGRAIARLFSKQFDKLVLSEVTDNSGRYSFMVGPNEYYVTFEKEGYQKATTGDIKIKEKDEVIKVDTGMEKLK